MKRNQKIALRKEKEEKIAQMEYEDSVGIRRKRFKPSFFTVKRLMIARIMLLACALLAFFLYSPLLFPVFALYGALYFIAKRTEKDANYGMKKHQRIKVPKIDALLALVMVVFCLGGTLLGAATTSTHSSMFEGKSEASLRAMMEERGMSTSKINSMIERMEENGMFLTSFEKGLLKTLTCYTGHRELFTEKNQMALRVGIRFGQRKRPEGSPPSDAPVMSESRPEGADFSSVPFDMIINQIISAASFILMLGILASGIVVIIRLRKIKLR